MEIFKGDPSSKTWLLINVPPIFADDDPFAKENLKPFSKVLEPEIGHTDLETLEAYEKPLSYIGYLYQSVDQDEPVYIVARKIISCAMFVPRLFIDLVEEKIPCALIILAHYFALLARYLSVWWIGKTPKREIEAIRDMLPDDHLEQMHRPLTMAGLATTGP